MQPSEFDRQNVILLSFILPYFLIKKQVCKQPRGTYTKKKGKVRDQYDLGDNLALITTDRQSAFDRVLAAIPFKGQVLNLASAWWFEETKHIIDNHILDVADPNVIIAKKCEVFPIEFVVRGFITGSTSTSIWTVYNNGDREYCGNILPE